jgi:Uma2 family endonuclease
MAAEQLITMPRHRFTVADFHRMGEAGILNEDSRVELIDGELIEMAPIGPKHASIVDLLSNCLSRQIDADKLLRTQNPIVLDRFGEVQPDIAIVRKRSYFDAHPGPEDALLLIEVSDRTIGYDRDTKIPRYAAHGIPEVWIVSVAERWIEIYREPQPSAQRYENIKRIDHGELSVLLVPEVMLALSDLWPGGAE